MSDCLKRVAMILQKHAKIRLREELVKLMRSDIDTYIAAGGVITLKAERKQEVRECILDIIDKSGITKDPFEAWMGLQKVEEDPDLFMNGMLIAKEIITERGLV